MTPDPETESNNQPIAYGSPEMEALLQRAEESIVRTDKLFADAGISIEDLDAALEEMPEEFRTAYEQIKAEDQQELSREWKAERKALLKNSGSGNASSDRDSSAAKKGKRTRIRL